MRADPPNPYVDLFLFDLHNVVGQRGADLQSGKQVGRRDTAYVLFAAASRLSPANDWEPGSPRNRVIAGESATEFLTTYERECRSIRFQLLQNAIDAAGFKPSELPQRDGWGVLAVDSAEGLARALAGLDEARAARQHLQTLGAQVTTEA